MVVALFLLLMGSSRGELFVVDDCSQQQSQQRCTLSVSSKSTGRAQSGLSNGCQIVQFGGVNDNTTSSLAELFDKILLEVLVWRC